MAICYNPLKKRKKIDIRVEELEAVELGKKRAREIKPSCLNKLWLKIWRL